MIDHKRGAALIALLLLLPAGCAVNTSLPKGAYSACRVLGSSDWKAHVEIVANNTPIPYLRRKLVVTGKVTTAGGGYYVSLDEGPVSRLDQPIQQIMIRTEGSAAAGGAAVTHDVRGVFPALDRYGGIELRCGDGIIAQIRDVAIPPREKGEGRLF